MSEHLWKTLSNLYPPTPDERLIANELYQEFLAQGYVRKTCSFLLGLSHAAISHFYVLLRESREPVSPVSQSENSSWMQDADFCFVNPRATSLDEGPGSFIQSAKLLPGLRASAIHLAPFTTCHYDAVYAISSIKTISSQVVDQPLVDLGYSAWMQVRAFVEAAHMLGKAVGYDFEPHLAQFSTTILEHPSYFRWIKVSETDRDRLDYGMSNDAMLSKSGQKRITNEVEQIVKQQFAIEGIETLEILEHDGVDVAHRKQQCVGTLINALIARGYWPVLLQHWGGIGVPAFKDYHHEGHYPRFSYFDRNGQDVSYQVYGVLTPFAFYENIYPNQTPDVQPSRNEAAIEFFEQIFPWWRDHFGFDFVRFDYVGHCFDSIKDGNPDFPISDRATPSVIQRCIQTAREDGHAFIGMLAERMGNEIEDYASVGFDVILGGDMREQIDRAHMEKCLTLYQRLSQLNRESSTSATIAYAIDTHDTGDPLMLGTPLLNLIGSKGILRRLFVSRFISCGLGRRPKYEVMGIQDMSYGLAEANVRPVSLTWVDDEEHNLAYHMLEDIAARFRPWLRLAEIMEYYIDDAYAWWMIEGQTTVLIPVLSLERGEQREDVWGIEITLPQRFQSAPKSVTWYDFTSLEGQPIDPGAGRCIRVEKLPYLSFGLYEVIYSEAPGLPGESP